MDECKKKQLHDCILKVKKDKSDTESWNYLYLGYKNYLLAVIRKIIFNYDSHQDVLQEVWLKLYKNIEKFDENREFKNWLGKIATNVCLTWLAKNKGDTGKEMSVRNVSYNDQYQEDAEENNFMEDFATAVYDRDAIERVFDEIKDKKKVLAFKYRFMDGLSLKTIAKMMDVPESTLHNWIYRVKDRLASILKSGFIF